MTTAKPITMRRWLLTGALLAGTMLARPAFADSAPEAPAPAADAPKAPEQIVITGSLGALPVKEVGSIFGFDKTLVDTPRSASTAAGLMSRHKRELDTFLAEAFA